MKLLSVEERAMKVLNSIEGLGAGFPRITSSDWIVLAVSGGPDSLTLLHVMANQPLHRTDRLVVAHLNHKLRPESDAEAEYVYQLASQWGIPCVVEEKNIGLNARDQGMSLEEAGRYARYDLLKKVAEQYGSAAVMTGHNAQDQVETVMMHILRGSGLSGLRGIQPVTFLPGSPSVLLIRPLLETDRHEIEEYCSVNKLSPLFDKSNLDTRFERNWIRQQLLPMMEEPGIVITC